MDWTPAEVKKKKEGDDAAGGGGDAVSTPMSAKRRRWWPSPAAVAPPFAAGPGFERLIAPPYREASNRDPGDALKVLLDAGANPNATVNRRCTLLHQAVAARRTDMIRALVAAGANFDAVNKDNLTPLLLAEKPEPPPPPGNNNDSRAWSPRRDSREEVIATLREMMHLGPNDPAPMPPPLPRQGQKKRRTPPPQPRRPRGRNEPTGRHSRPCLCRNGPAAPAGACGPQVRGAGGSRQHPGRACGATHGGPGRRRQNLSRPSRPVLHRLPQFADAAAGVPTR